VRASCAIISAQERQRRKQGQRRLSKPEPRAADRGQSVWLALVNGGQQGGKDAQRAVSGAHGRRCRAQRRGRRSKQR
jgi:hypothetical protein